MSKPTPHQNGITTPGPRKKPVHGGAEVTARSRVGRRVDAGIATRATPPVREASAPIAGPQSPAAKTNATKAGR